MHLVSPDSPGPDSPTPGSHRTGSPGADPHRTGSHSTASSSPGPGDTPVERLVVRPWHDPSLAELGEDPRGEYVERFWLGVVGPSVVLLLRRLSRGFDEHPPGYVISLPDTARAIGLSAGTARNSQVVRTVERACMFGLMRRHGDELEVRTMVPRLTPRQLARLPLAVQRSHDAWLARTATCPPAA